MKMKRRNFLKSIPVSLLSVSGCLNNNSNSTVNKNDLKLEPSDFLKYNPPYERKRKNISNIKRPSIGGGDLKVEIYEDLSCPHCKAYEEEIFPQIYKEYIQQGKISYEHRNLVIPVSKASLSSAIALFSVYNLGGTEAFLLYKNLLFKNQQEITNSANKIGQYSKIYTILAKEILSSNQSKKLETEFKNNFSKYEKIISETRAKSKTLGLKGVPSIVVNGEVQIANNYNEIVSLIEKYL